ncbi:MAG TPA: PspC domain-containing protein [Propionibacteriaceae bacterium]|nr:PspC domain-containing protein [Propionibacteriaceae bacterium]
MSSPYPPQPPKRLERSKSNRILGGVCAGVANYLNMDPTLVRVLTVVISLFTGVPVILYIIALFVVPEEGSQPASPSYPPVSGPQGQAAGFPTAPPQTAQPAYSPSGMSGPTQASQPPTPPVSAEDSVWGTEGAPWEQRQPAAEPTREPAFGAAPPSEPEPAPLPAHEADAFESVPEPEGPEVRPAGTDNPPTEPGGAAESAEPSEGRQQPDKS